MGFDVSCGVHQGCILTPTLFSLYFDGVIHMSLDSHRMQNKGVGVTYLVGNQEAMLTSLSTHCHNFGLSISCLKTKTTQQSFHSTSVHNLRPSILPPTSPLLSLSPASSTWEALYRMTDLEWDLRRRKTQRKMRGRKIT